MTFNMPYDALYLMKCSASGTEKLQKVDNQQHTWWEINWNWKLLNSCQYLLQIEFVNMNS
jgi:hypothetical protein